MFDQEFGQLNRISIKNNQLTQSIKVLMIEFYNSIKSAVISLSRHKNDGCFFQQILRQNERSVHS